MNTVTLNNENGFLKINNKGYFINTNSLNQFNDYQIKSLTTKLLYSNNPMELLSYNNEYLILTYLDKSNKEKALVIKNNETYIDDVKNIHDSINYDYLYELIDF